MKKGWRITRNLLLAVGLLMGTAAIVIAVAGKRLDKESKAFVDEAVPTIAQGWDLEELKKRASPEFDETVDYEDLAQIFDALQDLGRLTGYGGSTGEATITISVQNGIIISAIYDATAEFEEGLARIQISLIKHGDKWQILGFRVVPQEPGEEGFAI